MGKIIIEVIDLTAVAIFAGEKRLGPEAHDLFMDLTAAERYDYIIRAEKLIGNLEVLGNEEEL